MLSCAYSRPITYLLLCVLGCACTSTSFWFVDINNKILADYNVFIDYIELSMMTIGVHSKVIRSLVKVFYQCYSLLFHIGTLYHLIRHLGMAQINIFY